MAVEWGRAHQDLGGIEALGIDEIAWQRGHRYLTLVYQIDAHCKRLLWVGRERKSETLHGFFDWFGAARTEAVRFVCSDMWKAYLRVIAERAVAGFSMDTGCPFQRISPPSGVATPKMSFIRVDLPDPFSPRIA